MMKMFTINMHTQILNTVCSQYKGISKSVLILQNVHLLVYIYLLNNWETSLNNWKFVMKQWLWKNVKSIIKIKIKSQFDLANRLWGNKVKESD
jgi:hypothetical protein